MKTFKNITLITQVGLDLFTTVLICMLIGMGLDKLFKTKSSPFTVIFIFIGLAVGLRTMYLNLKHLALRDIKNEKNISDKNDEDKDL